MQYSVLTEFYERLESISAKLKKTEIISHLLKETPKDFLDEVVLLLLGRVFPIYSAEELGIANQLIIKAISKAYGVGNGIVVKSFKNTGDLGLTAESLAKAKKQKTLASKSLTVQKVFDNLRSIAKQTGSGSQEKKLMLIAELLAQAKPNEAKYIIRTILGQLRIGVAEGLLRDAIAKTFEVDVDAVDHAWSILCDFGEVARIAKEKGEKGLLGVKPELGKPIQVMLGEKAESIENVTKEFGKVAAEFKYDGMRAIIEKRGKDIWIYTRRLENVTKQFPDIKELVLKGVKADNYIIEGEALGIDPKTKKPLPFQKLSQRVHRKFDIKEVMKEIPVQLNLFDVIYYDGKLLIDKPFIERRNILEKIVKTIPGKLQLAEQIISDDAKELDKFYKRALQEKQEGLMLKVLKTPYTFGRHVGTMYKIKPIMENLDLVIIGATWGEGARAKWLTSYILACRDPDTGKFLECGMMSTGLTEKEYEEMTKILKPLITKEHGKTIYVKPKIVVEVGYQEIQKSPNYESGYALRFPTFQRFREDKGAEEADDLERVESLYKSQGRAG
jgi:DNA ligase-1